MPGIHIQPKVESINIVARAGDCLLKILSRNSIRFVGPSIVFVEGLSTAIVSFFF